MPFLLGLSTLRAFADGAKLREQANKKAAGIIPTAVAYRAT